MKKRKVVDKELKKKKKSNTPAIGNVKETKVLLSRDFRTQQGIKRTAT